MTLLKKGLGIQTVQNIYQDLEIGQKWSITDERGFTWWGHRLAQKIWADPPLEDREIPITRVHAETDFLKYPDSKAEIDNYLARAMMTASLNGYVVDRSKAPIRLRCNAFIHKENQMWLRELFELAVIMQMVEAETTVENISQMLKLEPDYSCHPQSGLRKEPDDMLNILDQLVIPEGKKSFDRIGEAQFSFVSEFLNNQNIFSTASESDLSGYVPFGRDLSLLYVTSDEVHPLLGHGILIRLFLPPEDIRSITCINGSLVMDMNTNEQKQSLTGHFMGSWCLGSMEKGIETLVFVTFIPAVACTPNVFANVVFSVLGHNTWAEGYFFSFEKQKEKEIYSQLPN
jgi:hypothetical protein